MTVTAANITSEIANAMTEQISASELDIKETVSPHYGEWIEDIEVRLENEKDYRLFLNIPSVRTEAQIFKDTDGYIQEGRLVLIVYAQNAYECVQRLHNVIAAIGLHTSTGRLGQPEQGPFDIGQVSFFKLYPIGLNKSSRKDGAGKYRIEQFFDFTIIWEGQ